MRIALLGDMAFFGQMSQNNNNNVEEYFSDIAEYLKSFDYVVGNLETPFSLKKKKHGAKSAYICADVEDVSLLKQLHVNAVTLANNHMFDFGVEGYETTKKVLHENGIEWFGTEGKELSIETEGNKISFSGFCCFTSNPLQCMPYGEYGVNAYNVEQVRKILSDNKKKEYLSIVAVHAGLEHVNYPSIEHVRIARLLAKESQYVYYGHHPHVIQGAEEYQGSIIAHSLGNFCFDDVYTDNSSEPLVTLSDNNRRGVILELEIEDSKVKCWKMQGIYISKGGKMSLLEQVQELDDYNAALAECENNAEQYSFKRQRTITERLNERKSARNLTWYLKRMRPKYVQIILNARKNTKEYQKNVLKYL